MIVFQFSDGSQYTKRGLSPITPVRVHVIVSWHLQCQRQARRNGRWLLHKLKITRFPGLVEPRFQWAIEP